MMLIMGTDKLIINNMKEATVVALHVQPLDYGNYLPGPPPKVSAGENFEKSHRKSVDFLKKIPFLTSKS